MINENVLCIIQARIGSTRFPGKVLKKINEKTILSYVYEATTKAKNINFTKIAIPLTRKDRELFQFQEVECYLGDQNNVLARYFKCYQAFEKRNKIKVGAVVRITSDCPLLYFVPEIIDSIIEEHFKGFYDYSWNRSESFESFPSGFDVEVIKPKLLDEMYLNMDNLTKEEKEHVTLFIRNNPGKYNILNYQDITNYLSGRTGKYSVDTKEDFERVSFLIDHYLNSGGEKLL